MLNWQWNIADQQIQVLFDGLIKQPLALKKRQLRVDLTAGEYTASLDDIEHFNRFNDFLTSLGGFKAEQCRDIALHACALLRFGRPLMPQSWYFQLSAAEPLPDDVQCCALNSGFSRGNMLILEQDERSSLCMLLDQEFEIDTTRHLQRYEMIRVLNDRIHASEWIHQPTSSAQSSLA